MSLPLEEFHAAPMLANRKMRQRTEVLKKRQSWLTARVAVKGDHLTFDKAELSALTWAIEELEMLYPDLKNVKWQG